MTMPHSLHHHPSLCAASLLLLLVFLTTLTVDNTQATRTDHYTLPPKAWLALRSHNAFNTKMAEQRLLDKIIWGLKSVVSRSSPLHGIAQGGRGVLLNVMRKRRGGGGGGGAVGRSAVFNRFLLAAVLNREKMLLDPPVGGQFISLANPDHYTLFRYG